MLRGFAAQSIHLLPRWEQAGISSGACTSGSITMRPVAGTNDGWEFPGTTEIYVFPNLPGAALGTGLPAARAPARLDDPRLALPPA